MENQSFLDEQIEQIKQPLQLDEGAIDPRYLKLSYSSLLTLHSCPRKFQLEKIGYRPEVDWESSVTFAFGHALGEGIQRLLIGDSLDDVIWQTFLAWDPPLLMSDDKRLKSFAYAVAAIEQFAAKMSEGMFEDYKVANYKGKPAVELSFRVQLQDGFKLRGYLDIALEHKYTGEVVVVEVKSDSGNYLQHLKYKNSAQGVGYSAILDKIEEGSSSYSVEYIVYMTRKEEFEVFSFPKTYQQRAMWLRDVIYDVEAIKSYVSNEGNYGIWPTHGESCMAFNRPCGYIDVCQLDTKGLMQHPTEDDLKDLSRNKDEVEYTFDMTLEELLAMENDDE